MPYRVGPIGNRSQRLVQSREAAEAGAGRGVPSPPCLAPTPPRPLLIPHPLLSKCDLITQIYAAQQDLPLREFASYFNGRTNLGVPPCLTSHELQKTPSRVIPMYPSLTQRTLKWFTSDSPECDNPDDPEFRCRCMQCSSARCPGEAGAGARTAANDRHEFRNNIMTFSDKQTMTALVNEVSCGICLGVGTLSETKNSNLSTDTTKLDDGKQPNCHTALCQPEEKCTSILKRPNRDGCRRSTRRKTIVYEECPLPRVVESRDEAVRDTDPEDHCLRNEKSRNQSCDQMRKQSRDSLRDVSWDRLINKERSCARHHKYSRSCYRCKDDTDEEEEENKCYNDSTNTQTRVMIYNEGISDEIANNLPQQFCAHKKPPIAPISPMDTMQGMCNMSTAWCQPDADNWIPYSHNTKSKYHKECKRQPGVRYRAACAEPGDIYHASDNGRTAKNVKKVIESKQVERKPCHPLCFSVPRKVLASERGIDEHFCRDDRSEHRSEY